MIDTEDLAVCRRSGHNAPGIALGANYWTQCTWCKMWLREVKTTTIEEREDEPPSNEQNPLVRRLVKE